MKIKKMIKYSLSALGALALAFVLGLKSIDHKAKALELTSNTNIVVYDIEDSTDGGITMSYIGDKTFRFSGIATSATASFPYLNLPHSFAWGSYTGVVIYKYDSSLGTGSSPRTAVRYSDASSTNARYTLTLSGSTNNRLSTSTPSTSGSTYSLTRMYFNLSSMTVGTEYDYTIKYEAIYVNSFETFESGNYYTSYDVYNYQNYLYKSLQAKFNDFFGDGGIIINLPAKDESYTPYTSEELQNLYSPLIDNFIERLKGQYSSLSSSFDSKVDDLLAYAKTTFRNSITSCESSNGDDSSLYCQTLIAIVPGADRFAYIKEYLNTAILNYNNSSYSQAVLDDYYNNGYQNGVNDTASISYKNGYTVGYQRGKNDGSREASDFNLITLADTLLSAPVNMFKNMFDFEFLGVNLSAFVLSLITLLVGIWLLKKLL